jgi:hypothetical protein
MAKKINHRGRGGHRELLFSVSSVLSVVFQNLISEDNKKSHQIRVIRFIRGIRDCECSERSRWHKISTSRWLRRCCAFTNYTNALQTWMLSYNLI